MRTLVASLLALALAAPPAAQGVIGADGVYAIADEAPSVVGGVAAVAKRVVYPEAALAAGVEGVVLVSLVVEPDGAARDLIVLRAPDPALGEAALAAFDGLTFSPGRAGGEAVPARLSVPVRFVLPEPAQADYADQTAQPLGGWERVLASVEWPLKARQYEMAGTVTLAVEVDKQGRVTDAEVVGLTTEGGVTRTEVRVVRVDSSQPAEAVTLDGPTSRLESLEDRVRGAVLDAVRAAAFVPEIRNGEAVAGRTRATVPFRAGG